MQLFLWTEADTGFLTDGAVSKSILFGGLLLALLLFIIMSAVCKNFPKTYKHEKKFLVAVTAALAGISVILRSVYEFYEIAVLVCRSAPEPLRRATPAFYVALSILGLFAAMTLFVTAGNFASGHSTYAAYPLFALILPLWHCYNLIIQFVSTVSGASVMENALEVLTLVFALLFLFPGEAVRRSGSGTRGAAVFYVRHAGRLVLHDVAVAGLCADSGRDTNCNIILITPAYCQSLPCALYSLFPGRIYPNGGKTHTENRGDTPPQPPVAEKSAPRSIPSSGLKRPFHSDTEPPAAPITGKLPPYGSIGEGSPHSGASRQKGRCIAATPGNAPGTGIQRRAAGRYTAYEADTQTGRWGKSTSRYQSCAFAGKTAPCSDGSRGGKRAPGSSGPNRPAL